MYHDLMKEARSLLSILFLIHDCLCLIFYKSHTATLIESVAVVHIKPMSTFLQRLHPFQSHDFEFNQRA